MAIGTRGGIKKSLQETQANYFDDLCDSLSFGPQYMDFLSGYVGNLTATSRSLTDAVIDAAGAAGGGGVAAIGNATVSASALNDFLGTSDAVGGVFLPTATANTHLAIQITGDMDAANAITFNTSGSACVGEDSNNAVFAKQIIGPEMGDSSATAQTVVTAGLPSAPASNRLIYTPAAAATNFLSVGSIMHFYCPIDNQWLVKVFNVKEGSGATGTFTVGS